MLLPIESASPQHVGEQILLLRTRQRMSQDTLAELSGISRVTIARIENGITKAPSMDTIALLLRALGIETKTANWTERVTA